MIRFGGLATGQDTESIVNALLEVERQPILRLEEDIIDEEEKYSAWSELDTKVSDLHSKVEKLNSFLTWRQFDVSSTNEMSFPEVPITVLRLRLMTSMYLLLLKNI